MSSIFGFDKNTLLKRKIIDTLDSQTQAFTYKELAETIQIASVSTLHTICRELADLIDELYPDHSCSLVIRKENHGTTVTLQRSSDNLQKFYDYLYSSDMAYKVLQTLLIERKTSTVLFCINHGLSESSLKRKIKDINHEISAFDLRITCAKQLTLRGPEVKIRAFHYIFLRSIHRQFFTIPSLRNLDLDYQLAEEIAEELKVSHDPTLVERFAYWVLITRTALSKGKTLHLSPDDLDILATLQLPDKPLFLTHWSTQDWSFLVTVVYCSLSENFQLPMREENLENPSLQQSWIQLFQKNFRLLTRKEERFVRMKLNQLTVTMYFFPLSGSFLTTLQTFVGLEELSELYPLYLRRFESFWQEWSQHLPSDDLEMFHMFSLSTCISIIPMDELRPEIAVYIYSETSDSFKQYLKIKLNFYYSTRYALVFVKTPEEADLLISTVPLLTKYCPYQQKLLVVRARVTPKDLENIGNRLHELFENQIRAK
ncbi:helix-turn-helix domain-containing protein [Enterococcus sp. AZ109]|uniref:helix-turn-helix domain-containing protein n=1 Tax=Enterococcus sp. AZ109 TaxID=2774634 RepID=UPI003F299A77